MGAAVVAAPQVGQNRSPGCTGWPWGQDAVPVIVFLPSSPPFVPQGGPTPQGRTPLLRRVTLVSVSTCVPPVSFAYSPEPTWEATISGS